MLQRYYAFFTLIVIFTAGFLLPLRAQTVIFSEDFTAEFNGNTTGVSTEGIAWNAACPDCIDAGDFFETQTGQLRGNDTNGPAFFTANGIDATGCLVLTFQFDYNSVGYLGGGNLECASECIIGSPPCT
ncbi:MAG: hypothetical protein AAFU67_18940, partial [Bacteroidota bacterium]